MAQDKHYDVIIIGTGAGGGTLVHTLASTGKSILILERGDYVPREKANWDSRAVNVEAKYQTKEEWRDKDGKPLHPHTNYYVGGNTKFYGAALFRLRKTEPQLKRPFRARLYPFSPIWTLFCATICIASVAYYNRLITVLFLGLVLAGYVVLRLTLRKNA